MTYWRYRNFSVPFDFSMEDLLANLFAAVRELRKLELGKSGGAERLRSAVRSFFSLIFGEDGCAALIAGFDTDRDYIDAFRDFAEFVSRVCSDAVCETLKAEEKYLNTLEDGR